MGRDQRQHERLPFKGRIRISWQDEGIKRMIIGVCDDASRTGVRVTAPTRIPDRCFVQLEGLDFKLFGPACVRNCDRQGMWFKLGLEFAGGIKLVIDGKEQRINAA